MELKRHPDALKVVFWRMRQIWGLLGSLLAQTFYVEIQNEALQQALRRTGSISALRVQALWRGLEEVRPLFSQSSGVLRGWFEMRFRGEDSLTVMERLRLSSDVRVVEGASRRRLCASPLIGWHHVALGTAAAWTRTQGSPQIVVAIVDSGIEWDLPAFHRQFWINPAEDLNGNGKLDQNDLNGIDEDQNGFTDDVIGYDFTDQVFGVGSGDILGMDPLPRDENGHGTAMASLIGARSDRSPVAGLAQGCRLMILRCFASDGYGEDDDIARAIVYAADNGARVINCSFGDRVPSRMMHAAIQYAVSRGCVIVASSGNGTGRAPHFPSGFPEVISAGGLAYDESTGRYFLWPLSGYYRVDWVAPADRVPALVPNGTIQTLSGTSISSALTSAAVALLLSRYPNLSEADVRATFASRAITLSGGGWSFTAGSGRLTLLPSLDYPQEATAGWLYPADNSHVTGLVPFIFSTYHSLLAEWDISYASALEGPWTFLRGGSTARLRDTLDGWLPPIGTSHLRLRLRLRNGREVVYPLTFTYEPSGVVLRQIQSAPGWWSGISCVITNWATNLPVTGCVSADGSFACADKIDSVGAVWLPTSGINPKVVLSSFSDTLRIPLSLPNVTPRALAYAPWQFPSTFAPIGFYLAQLGEDWNLDGEKDLIVSGLSSEDGRIGRVYYLNRQGSTYQPYDSINTFPLLPRHLADWDGDGQPELLCVWIDSFYVFSGTPPKNLLWKGQGRAARLAYPNSVWLRSEVGAYELYHMTRGRQLSLADTVNWMGSTTVPHLLPVPTPGETLWVFGNYSGWLFIYRPDGSLLRAVSTHLADVGSHLAAIDVDADGWTEVLYLGQGASKDWWELGLFSVQNGTVLWRERFWGGVSGYARLFLRETTALVWLPPHLYIGEVGHTHWSGEGFDAGVWGVFGLWSQNGRFRVLMGRDTLPRFYEYLAPVSAAVTWAKPGGLSPSSARLRWYRLPSASTYRLYRVSFSDGSVVLRYIGSDTNYIEGGLQRGERYAFFVEANGIISEPFLLIPWERPCFTEAQIDSTGLCTLRGTGTWTGEYAEGFRLMPDSLSPFFAWANGNIWILSFSAQAQAESLFIDTLLTDIRGMYLQGGCARVRVQNGRTYSCFLPIQWRISGEREVEVEFSASLPTEAYKIEHYEVLPYGQVQSVEPILNGIRLHLSVNPATQPILLRWRWDAERCPQTVAFSPSERSGKRWGVFPNPLRVGQKVLYVWGLEAGEQVRVFSTAGELCAIIHASDNEVPTAWEPRTYRGERLAPGVYLLERQGKYEKLYVE